MVLQEVQAAHDRGTIATRGFMLGLLADGEMR